MILKERALAIVGNGYHGKVVADAAEMSGQWQHIVFFDDSVITAPIEGPWALKGNTDNLMRTATHYAGCIVAIGNSKTRLRFGTQLQVAGARLVTVVHPSAVVSRYCDIKPGTFISSQAVVHIGSVLGAACIVNTGAIVEHHCELGDGVHICPGATLAGGVRVGRSSWISVGAAVRPRVQIGSDVTVGAGATVVSNVANGLTVTGTPAKTRPTQALATTK